MTLLHCFIAADSGLGKIDKHSLSQQTLMELLIDGFTKNKEKICGDTNEIQNVEKWRGVSMNSSNEVREVFFPSLALEGSLELKWLPFAMKHAYFSYNSLSGTIDFTCLPDKLEILNLQSNQFCGSVDLTRLPPCLRQIFMQDNAFSGKTDFSALPVSMKSLNVSRTQLEGEVFVFDGNLWIDESKVKDMRKK